MENSYSRVETVWYSASRAIVGDGTTIVAPAFLAVKGGAIQQISSARPSVDGIIDLGDVTIVPGLMNLHDHISRKFIRDRRGALTFSQASLTFMNQSHHYLLLHSVRNAADALAEGVTYLRDYGLAGDTSIHLKLAIAEGLVAGPEMSVSGHPVCMTGGHTYRLSHEADGPDGVRAAVRSELRAGADVIKLMASGGIEHFPKEDPTICELTEDELRAGIEAAHEAGVLTAAHSYPARATLNAVRAGIDSIEHGVFLDEACVEEMVTNRTALVPTFSGLRGTLQQDDPRRTSRTGALWERIFIPHEDSVRRAHQAGILIGTGSDTAGSVAEEVRIIATVLGLTPVEAIAHATGIAARIARRSDIGLLESGRRANFATFTGDLTASLDGLTRADGVWLDGNRVI